MRVRLQNFAGLDEAGIDGGGIFREFLSELIKTAFDPNRGFFLSTSDKLLYPNPQARLIVEKFEEHFYFLGRILGKVGKFGNPEEQLVPNFNYLPAYSMIRKRFSNINFRTESLLILFLCQVIANIVVKFCDETWGKPSIAHFKLSGN